MNAFMNWSLGLVARLYIVPKMRGRYGETSAYPALAVYTPLCRPKPSGVTHSPTGHAAIASWTTETVILFRMVAVGWLVVVGWVVAIGWLLVVGRVLLVGWLIAV